MRSPEALRLTIRPRKVLLFLGVAVVLLVLGSSLSLAEDATTVFDQDDHEIKYEGTWEATASPGAYGDEIKVGSGPFAQFSVAFDGPSITWIADKGPSYGRARVWYNGNPLPDVDLYSPVVLKQQRVFTRAYLGDGTHTLKVMWKNEASGGGKDINIDAIEVAGRLGSYPIPQDDAFTVLEDGVLTAPSGGLMTNDNDDPHVLYVEDWTETSHGDLDVREDGGFTYTPDDGYHGADSFTYSVIDGDGHSSDGTATVRITVTAVAEYTDIQGANRFETAARAALTGWPAGADTVVLATGYNFPDALGGSVLAGAFDAPLLLVNADSLPAAAANAIVRLGAKHAIILGGETVVTEKVAANVAAVMGPGAVVERIAGANRYATARRVASRAIGEMDAYDGTAFVATGSGFPDALASGPISACAGWPVYLMGGEAENETTIAAMKAAGVTSVKVLGGEVAVPKATYNALAAAFPGKVSRVAGANRYETAARVAELAGSAGMVWEGAGIASGANFPDALAAGALLGRVRAPLLLSSPTSLSDPAAARLQAHRAEISDLRFFGGPSALSEAVRTRAKQIAEQP